MTTFSAPARPSVSEKPRPRRICTPAVAKKPGLTVTDVTCGGSSPALRAGRPSISNPRRHPPNGGTLVVSAAASTPAIPVSLGMSRS